MVKLHYILMRGSRQFSIWTQMQKFVRSINQLGQMTRIGFLEQAFKGTMKVGTFCQVSVSMRTGMIWMPGRQVTDRSISRETVGMMSAAVVDQIYSETSTIASGVGQDDARLVERIRTGDRLAFEQLVVTYQPGVYGLIYRAIEDAEEARDLAQETFLKVYQKIEQFRGESSLRTWIYRIAMRQASNHRRWSFRRRRHRTISIDEPWDGDQRSVSETLADVRPDCETVLIDRERDRRLVRALGRMKSSYRAAVILRDVEGCTYEEIADILRISLGTVKSRIARGREMLRRELVKDSPGMDD